jgi:hypothetical protein
MPISSDLIELTGMNGLIYIDFSLLSKLNYWPQSVLWSYSNVRPHAAIGGIPPKQLLNVA